MQAQVTAKPKLVPNGGINLTLEITNDELRIPGDILSGTVGMTILTVIDNEVRQAQVEAVFSIVGGAKTLRFRNTSDWEKVANAITIISITTQANEIIKTIEQ